MKRNKQIVCVNGHAEALKYVSRKILELSFQNPTMAFVEIRGEEVKGANRVKDILSMVNQCVSAPGNAGIIVTNFPSTVAEAEAFSNGIVSKHVALHGISITAVKGERSDSTFAMEYFSSVTRDYAGHVGAAMYEQGLEKKLLIDVLGITANFDHKITVSGSSATGKSTVTGALNREFKFKVHSAGDHVTRPFAETRGFDIDTFINVVMKENPALRDEYDITVDEWNKQRLKEPGRLVLDARLGALWGPNTFKVLCTVSDATAGTRAFNAAREKRINQKVFSSVEEAIRETAEKNAKDKQEYLDKYQFDYLNEAHYDAVLDADALDQAQMAEKIVADYTTFLFKRMMQSEQQVAVAM